MTMTYPNDPTDYTHPAHVTGYSDSSIKARDRDGREYSAADVVEVELTLNRALTHAEAAAFTRSGVEAEGGVATLRHVRFPFRGVHSEVRAINSSLQEANNQVHQDGERRAATETAARELFSKHQWNV